MKKRTFRVSFVSLVVLIIVSLVHFSNAEAYSLKAWTIRNPVNFIPHQDFGSTSISHMNSGLAKWNYQIGETLMTRHPTTRHTYSNYPLREGINRVYRVPVGTDEYLGQNTTYYSLLTGTVEDTDININVSHPWANSAQPGKYDLYTVFLHEAGHAAGLGHSSYTAAVMYAYTSPNTTKRYLHSDDINGINAKYP